METQMIINYLLISLMATILGGLGAVALESAVSRLMESSKKLESLHFKPKFNRWTQKLIIALIAALTTPLTLYFLDERVILESLIEPGLNRLIYFGYALILSTFGEQVLQLLYRIISRMEEIVLSFIQPNR